jgi:hypothetical protein
MQRRFRNAAALALIAATFAPAADAMERQRESLDRLLEQVRAFRLQPPPGAWLFRWVVTDLERERIEKHLRAHGHGAWPGSRIRFDDGGDGHTFVMTGQLDATEERGWLWGIEGLQYATLAIDMSDWTSLVDREGTPAWALQLDKQAQALEALAKQVDALVEQGRAIANAPRPAIVIGEDHKDAAPRESIVGHLPALVRAGVTMLGLENIDDGLQADLDAYLATGKESVPLAATLSRLGGPAGGQRALLHAARTAGIKRVIALDSAATEYFKAGLRRQITQNAVALANIARAKVPGGIVLLEGSAHTHGISLGLGTEHMVEFDWDDEPAQQLAELVSALEKKATARAVRHRAARRGKLLPVGAPELDALLAKDGLSELGAWRQSRTGRLVLTLGAQRLQAVLSRRKEGLPQLAGRVGELVRAAYYLRGKPFVQRRDKPGSAYDIVVSPLDLKGNCDCF